MTTVLVTGAAGFLGTNLLVALGRREGVVVRTFELGDGPEALDAAAEGVDVIFHLAGVNRPQREEEFAEGNTALTKGILAALRRRSATPRIVLPSSTQAVLDNAYGRSKRAAEIALFEFAGETGADVRVYRLPGVFGKWSRPFYNSVVATFCHNIARGAPITIADPDRAIDLVYVDDVIDEFVSLLDAPVRPLEGPCGIPRTVTLSLGVLAERIRGFDEMRRTLRVPDLSDEFGRRLYATYVSFLPEDALSYPLEVRRDGRGELFELLRSVHVGQVFLSKTRPGAVRGNHYHDSKVEKFCVVEGRAIIRFRHVRRHEIVEYPVSGDRVEVVDIPPGYTHSIENVGQGEMIVVFWANESFDPTRPDTHALEV